MRWVAALLLLAGCTVTPPADADEPCWDTAWRCRDVNQLRAEHDRQPLNQVIGLQDDAGAWADELAASGNLRHDPTVTSSEIVGYGPDFATVLAAFMDSEHHREILLGHYGQVGIGVQRADGLAWVCVRFR